MNKLVFMILGFFAVVSVAQPIKDSTRIEDIAFSHVAIAIEGGEVYPFGDLIDAVYNTYYGGLDFRYSYWENVDGVVMFHYSYFEPRPKGIPYDGVHQFMGKLGLDWRFKIIDPIVLGGGFACNWTRADGGINNETNYMKPGGTLFDNETEFGWYARMKVDIIKLEKYRLGLNVMWEELWTLPKRSDMLYAGLYIERSLW